MIFLHIILGLILGKLFGNFWFFVLGSIFPDVDHIYVIIKNRIFSWKKYVTSMKDEKKYGIRYKTSIVHSFLGLVIFSFTVCLFNFYGGLVFGIAYLLHLLVDWIDIDEKYYLFPSRIKFKGFLPIWSGFEKIITVIGLIILVIVSI